MRIEKGLLTGVLDADGELSDEAARHIHNVIVTKAAILQYIEPIAQVIAEAGRASAKAMGDDPHYAVQRWVNVIQERANEIIHEVEEREAAEAADPFKQGTVGHDGRNPLRELVGKG